MLQVYILGEGQLAGRTVEVWILVIAIPRSEVNILVGKALAGERMELSILVGYKMRVSMLSR